MVTPMGVLRGGKRGKCPGPREIWGPAQRALSSNSKSRENNIFVASFLECALFFVTQEAVTESWAPLEHPRVNIIESVCLKNIRNMFFTLCFLNCENMICFNVIMFNFLINSLRPFQFAKFVDSDYRKNCLVILALIEKDRDCFI